jgi:hypothetical protein
MSPAGVETPDALAQESGEAMPNWLFIACGLSWGAGLIHIGAAIGHADESGLYTLFFALLAPLQLGWGFLMCRRRSHGLVVLGLVLSLVVVAVWVMSRTTGMPVGPEPWHPERVGVIDAVATGDELVLALLIWSFAWPRQGRLRSLVGAAAKPCAIALIVLSSLSLLSAGHGS